MVGSFVIRSIITRNDIESEEDRNYYMKCDVNHVRSRVLPQNVQRCLLAGSRAENLACPLYKDRQSGKAYMGDQDIMMILKPDILADSIKIEPIEEQHNYCLLFDINNQKYISSSFVKHNIDIQPLEGEDAFNEVQGPARFNNECEYLAEYVPSVDFNYWPEVADEWVKRQRPSGWPEQKLVQSIMKDGFYIVPVGRQNSKTTADEWRLSFSMAEVALANSLSSDQRYVYIVAKLFLNQQYEISIKTSDKYDECENPNIPTYFIKTLFFWLCERNPKHYWRRDNIFQMVQYILREVLTCYSERHLSHYFISHVNLLAAVSNSEADFKVAKIQYLIQNFIPCLLAFDTKFRFNCSGRQESLSDFLPSIQIVPVSSTKYINPLFTMSLLHTKTLFLSLLHTKTLFLDMNRPLKDDDITDDVASWIYTRFNMIRACADMVEEYYSLNSDLSDTEIISWIVGKIVLLEIPPYILSLILGYMLAILNYRENGLYFDLTSKGLMEYKEFVVTHEDTQSDDIRTVCFMFDMLHNIVDLIIFSVNERLEKHIYVLGVWARYIVHVGKNTEFDTFLRMLNRQRYLTWLIMVSLQIRLLYFTITKYDNVAM